MEYWESGVVVTGLVLAALLLAAELLRRALPPLARLGVPGSIVAGVLGLALGSDGLAVLPLDRAALESIVYHGLAIVFIAIALQSKRQARRGACAASMAFSVPLLSVVQGILGLGFVLLLGRAAREPLHPSLGMLLPLGFEQGPGQALAMGKAWERFGLADGAQLGLIVAAIGFAWSVLCGVPLVRWCRARGLFAPRVAATPAGAAADERAADALGSAPGAIEPLTRQLAAVGAVYLATYGLVRGAAHLLADAPQHAAMVYGFHFVLGACVALAVRWILDRRTAPGHVGPLHDGLLGRVAGLTVDAVTCAALAAIDVQVLTANWLAILVMTTLGGFATLGLCLWLARRAFPEAPYEHAVVLFGMGTGTLPMGLALLRIVDPDLTSAAPASAVLGSAGALLLGIPLFLILPLPAAGWPDLGASWLTLGLLALYLLVLVTVWSRFGPLRLARPPRSPHPGETEEYAS